MPSPMPEFDPVITARRPDRDVVMLMMRPLRMLRSQTPYAPRARRKPVPRGIGTKKTPARGGRQLLRQVSYRQETYRAVPPYTPNAAVCPTEKFENVIEQG
jgi:hypothetical protein